MGFWGGSVVKNPPTIAGDTGSIPGSGRFSGEGNGNPFQYSCLGNPMDRGAWGNTVHGVTKSRTWLSTMHKWKDTYNWIRKVSNQNRSDCTLYRKESAIAHGGKEYLKAHVEIETSSGWDRQVLLNLAKVHLFFSPKDIKAQLKTAATKLTQTSTISALFPWLFYETEQNYISSFRYCN